MRIGDLARRTGVSVRALRYYEERDLLHPERTTAGYRIFAESDVGRVERIRSLLAAGIPTELIAEILSCMVGDSLLLADCRERLLAERARMTSTIEQLAEARSLLDTLLVTAA